MIGYRDNRFPVLSRIMGRVKRANETRGTMRHAVPVDLRQSTRKMKNWKKPDGAQTVKNFARNTWNLYITFRESTIDLDGEYIFMN